MMTIDDTGQLLAMISAFDGREFDANAVVAWHAVACHAAWRPSWARQAVIEWHARGAAKTAMKPADITDYLEAKKSQLRKLAIGDAPLEPPRSLDGDVTAELAWRRRALAEIEARAMDAWSDNRPVGQLTRSQIQALGSGTAA